MTGDGLSTTGREADTRAAVEVKALQAAGELERARERFADLVNRHQRRALRIAFLYVRDATDADEAVQEPFWQAYSRTGTCREELPYEVWFTRILINGCLDRLKARKRREKWLAPPSIDPSGVERNPTDYVPARGPSPEEQVLRQERRRQLHAALAQLPERQRLVFALSHFDGRSSREVSEMTGLNESTVRVHLFRAIRRLRTLLVKNSSASAAGSRRSSRAAY